LRLSQKELETIKSTARSIFVEVGIYLFGSRVDDSKKGGDIDLYIVSSLHKDIFQKKRRLKVMLEDLLFKPVDIVLSRDPKSPIEKEALKGVRILYKKE